MNFSTLKPSPRMPVLFLGHGSPMNAILDNAYRRSWQALGRRFDGSSCRIPDDCIDSKRYPLFMAREVMRGVIQEFQSTGG